MVNASLIICTHNPRRHFLDRTLASLRTQELPYDQWELLVIDNASEPPLDSRFDISWHPNGQLVRERELGLAAARRRGISEAVGTLLVFVDDDNILANDYLSEALTISREWPTLGTWGSGSISPEFEQPPPDHLRPYLGDLALRDNNRPNWSNVLSCSEATPAGAGMCVRRGVADEYRRLQQTETIRLTGRQGTALVGHDDYEIAYVGCSIGLGMGVFPQLKLIHLIPKERVTERYLLRLAEGNQLSKGLLEYKWLNKAPLNPFSSWGILSFVKNVVMTSGFHRRYHLAFIRGRIAARRALAKYKSEHAA